LVAKRQSRVHRPAAVQAPVGPWRFGAAALSPDAAKIAIGTDQVTIVDARTGESVGSAFGFIRESADSTATIDALTWHGAEPVACSSAGFIGDAPATIHIVRATSSPVSFDAHVGSMTAAARLPRDRLLTSGRKDGHVTIRDPSKVPLCELKGLQGTLWSIGVSSDASTVAALTDSQSLVWDLARCSTPM